MISLPRSCFAASRRYVLGQVNHRCNAIPSAGMEKNDHHQSVPICTVEDFVDYSANRDEIKPCGSLMRLSTCHIREDANFPLRGENNHLLRCQDDELTSFYGREGVRSAHSNDWEGRGQVFIACLLPRANPSSSRILPPPARTSQDIKPFHIRCQLGQHVLTAFFLAARAAIMLAYSSLPAFVSGRLQMGSLWGIEAANQRLFVTTQRIAG